MDVASMHLEGDALDLYSWLSADQEIEYWEDLVRALQKNFGPAEFQNPDEHLCSIRQTGTVQEYRQEFAKRSSRVTNWPEHCLLGVFLNGLKEELRADVRIHKPRTVYKAMSIAHEFESKADSNRSGPNLKQTAVKTAPVTTSPASTTSPVRISEAEKQARYIKGECFRCGEKYGPGHRCKTSSLQLLDAGDQNVKELLEAEEEAEDIAQISLHALVGTPHHPTLIVHGSINNFKVSILIDCGSTHNFITASLVPKIGLSTHEVVPFGVKIGNGDIIRCSQICKDVVLHIADLQITQNFYPFSLGGADVVLGIQWLATLNTVQANWREMFLKFTLGGRDYKLQGMMPETHNSATFHHLTFEPFEKKSAARSGRRLEGKSFFQGGCYDTNPANQPSGVSGLVGV
ncbi:putative retrotransposon gag domain, aspartic peptidase domain superfamily [Helianthus anomalus]